MFTDALDAITADFEQRADKYLAQQRRNPGRVLPELAALHRERDDRIGELTRAHQIAQALEWAERDQPGRLLDARERQAGQAAARSLEIDLGRGRFARSRAEQAGRDVRHTWVW